MAHPPREPEMPCCDLCGDWHRVSHFCEAHRAEAAAVFKK
jgi:hypothetical protein